MTPHLYYLYVVAGTIDGIPAAKAQVWARTGEDAIKVARKGHPDRDVVVWVDVQRLLWTPSMEQC
jgi:hypothetical protein